MTTYDLYAVDADSIIEARHYVEQVLQVSFVEHDSSFHRGPYFSAGEKGGENFEIKFNMDPYEDEPFETDFPDTPYLLYVNNTSRPDSLKVTLLNKNVIHHLKRVDT